MKDLMKMHIPRTRKRRVDGDTSINIGVTQEQFNYVELLKSKKLIMNRSAYVRNLIHQDMERRRLMGNNHE